MAYYSKQDILDYVSENMKDIEAKGLRTLNPEPEVHKRLNDEEDLVAFFWIDFQEGENEGEKIKMQGKSWYRINHDLYTDDRFAIDLYQAMIEEVTVTDIIKRREKEKELAKQGIVDINAVEDKIKNSITKENEEEDGA